MNDKENRYEQLQRAVSEYGEAAFENLIRCRGLANAILETLPAFLGCASDCVRAAPPAGPFDPTKMYGDYAFSFAHRPVVALEPLRFGVAVIIKNVEDSGLLWLRTALAIELTGDSFDVYVAHRSVLQLPLPFDDDLSLVHEAIFDEFLQTFKIRLMNFEDRRFESGIGFLPER